MSIHTYMFHVIIEKYLSFTLDAKDSINLVSLELVYFAIATIKAEVARGWPIGKGG